MIKFWEKKTVKNDKAVYQFLRQILAIFGQILDNKKR